jgi:hypothetical protein
MTDLRDITAERDGLQRRVSEMETQMRKQAVANVAYEGYWIDKTTDLQARVKELEGERDSALNLAQEHWEKMLGFDQARVRAEARIAELEKEIAELTHDYAGMFSGEAMDWKPIETVPLDPTAPALLLWCPRNYGPEQLGYPHHVSYGAYIARHGPEGLRRLGYTHWMPLPVPPTEEPE